MGAGMILEPVPLRPVPLSPVRLRPGFLRIVPIRAIDLRTWAPEKVRRPGRTKTAVLRKALLKRHGSLCHWCRRPMARGDISTEHLVPLALGGDNSWENLRLAHVRCNMRRGATMGAP